MIISSRLLTALAIATICFAFGSLTCASIVIEEGSTIAEVSSSVYGYAFEETIDLVSATASASVSRSFSQTSSVFGTTEIFGEFYQDRPGVFGDTAEGQGQSGATAQSYETYRTEGESRTGFTARNNETYAIVGSFGNGSDGVTCLDISLYDVTDGLFLFRNSQEVNGGGASLVVGGTQGIYELSGSQTGFLAEGHNYIAYVLTSTYAYPGEGSGGLAEGGFSFRFGDVPEPSSFLIWCGLGLVAISRRRNG